MLVPFDADGSCVEGAGAAGCGAGAGAVVAGSVTVGSGIWVGVGVGIGVGVAVIVTVGVTVVVATGAGTSDADAHTTPPNTAPTTAIVAPLMTSDFFCMVDNLVHPEPRREEICYTFILTWENAGNLP